MQHRADDDISTGRARELRTVPGGLRYMFEEDYDLTAAWGICVTSLLGSVLWVALAAVL
jgi:hypothetical protein